MEPIRTFSARCVALPLENIDTDQITPAEKLKITDKLGLAQWLFARWRYLENGQPNPDFILNQPRAQGAQVLVAGDNFGCGSSREHAPWALVGYGFKAVISTSIADIFKNNALKNGLLPIVVDEAAHQQLLALCEDGAPEVTVDLEAQQLTLPDGRVVSFPIEPFARYCLLNGLDELGFLLDAQQDIASYEQRRAEVGV